MALALVRDLREQRRQQSAEELAALETDVLAGFVLARASAGLADSTIRNDTGHLELIRDWFGRPLWEMQPADADAYFGRVLRDAKPSTRTGRAAALAVYFQFLELRHKAEIYNLTGRVAECPLDEMNRPRPRSTRSCASRRPRRRSSGCSPGGARNWRPAGSSPRPPGTTPPPGWQADVGLRVNEVRMLDLDDVRWELGRFGKLNVRHGKGSRRQGAQAPAGAADQRRRTGTCAGSSRTCGASSATTTTGPAPRCSRPSASAGTAPARGRPTTCSAGRWPRPPAATCPAWSGKLTPHVLRHFCASQLYRSGMSLFAIQELLGHSWTGTTARYVHVHATHVEDAWVAGQQRAADRWKGLAP